MEGKKSHKENDLHKNGKFSVKPKLKINFIEM